MKAWDRFYSKEFKLRDYLGSIYTHTDLFEEIISEKPKKVLDVGAGTGITSLFLSHLGYEVTVIDNNDGVLHSARKFSDRFNGEVDYVLCDAFNLRGKFKVNEFDIAFSQGFFEHFENEQICRLIQEQLKIARVVLISVPSNFYMKKDFGNERLMSAKKWQNILKECNFNVDFIRYYGFHLPTRESLYNFIFNPLRIYKFITGTVMKERSHLLIKIKH